MFESLKKKPVVAPAAVAPTPSSPAPKPVTGSEIIVRFKDHQQARDCWQLLMSKENSAASYELLVDGQRSSFIDFDG